MQVFVVLEQEPGCDEAPTIIKAVCSTEEKAHAIVTALEERRDTMANEHWRGSRDDSPEDDLWWEIETVEIDAYVDLSIFVPDQEEK